MKQNELTSVIEQKKKSWRTEIELIIKEPIETSTTAQKKLVLTRDDMDELKERQGMVGEPGHPKSTHRLLHSMWQRAGEPETLAQTAHGKPETTQRLLHSLRKGTGNQRDILSAQYSSQKNIKKLPSSH